jgi:hypothetical protein
MSDSRIEPAFNAGMQIMPTHSGVIEAMQAQPSTRAQSFQGSSVSASDTQTAVSVSFLSDGKALQALLPPGKNLFIHGDPVVTVVSVYQGGLRWLAGRTYNLVLVILPVVHEGKSARTVGGFLPVVWENMTEPILMGRETLGWPKIYAELPPLRKLNDTMQCVAAWQGFKFLDIGLSGLRAMSDEELKARSEKQPKSVGLICHKYIVRTGSPGQADADYLTLSTDEGAVQPTYREFLTGIADIRFFKATWEQLPTMTHIVAKLADLEVKRIVDVIVTTQAGGGMGKTTILD